MDCKELQQNMFALIDEELPERRKCACRRHISLCGKCRTLLERETKLEELIVRSCREIAPPTLKERLFRVIRQAQAIADSGVSPPCPEEGLG